MDRIDKKILCLGFTKVEEDEFGVRYERSYPGYNFIQVVTLLHKKNEEAIIQSYDRDLMDKNKIGNVGVGLTYKEARLFLKKMKMIGLA